MGVRKPPRPTVLPSALVCAFFQDKARALFLEQIDERGMVRLELPGLLINEGEDPVSALAAYLRSTLSIDAQIHLICLRGRFNVGTRKRRHVIPALAFACSAKKVSPKIAAPYSGAVWLAAEDAFERKLGRNTEWLKSAERV